MAFFDYSDPAQWEQSAQMAQDPMTPTETIHRLLQDWYGTYWFGINLSQEHQRARDEIVCPCLRNPSIGGQDLWHWIESFPFEVAENPVIALLELETPGFVYRLLHQVQSYITIPQIIEGPGIAAAMGGPVRRYLRNDERWQPVAFAWGGELPPELILYRNGIVTMPPHEHARFWTIFASFDDMMRRCGWQVYDFKTHTRRRLTLEEVLSMYDVTPVEGQAHDDL